MRKDSLTVLVEKTMRAVEKTMRADKENTLRRYNKLKNAVYEAFVVNASKKRPDYFHHAKERLYSIAQSGESVVKDLLIDLCLWEESKDAYERVMNTLLRKKVSA